MPREMARAVGLTLTNCRWPFRGKMSTKLFQGYSCYLHVVIRLKYEFFDKKLAGTDPCSNCSNPRLISLNVVLSMIET